MKPYFVHIITEGAPLSSIVSYRTEKQARDYAQGLWGRLSIEDKTKIKLTVGKIVKYDADGLKYEVLDTLQEVSA